MRPYIHLITAAVLAAAVIGSTLVVTRHRDRRRGQADGLDPWFVGYQQGWDDRGVAEQRARS